MKIQKTAIFALLAITILIFSACGGGGGGGTTNLPPSISTQPSNKNIVAGNNTSFSVTASGTGLTYQWQVDANSGTFINVSDTGVYTGSTTATLTLTGATFSMNGYKYRVIVSGTVAPAATSNGIATLTVTQATKAIVKLATSGSLASGVLIGGISTAVFYPSNVLSFVDVVSSGGAVGTTPTSSTTPGRVGFTNLFNEIPSGIPAGEFAIFTFTITGAPPVASDFTIDTSVINNVPTTAVYDNNANLLGLSVVIQSVTFQ